MNTTLENTLASLPITPGIYKMKDEEGKIIYIGKAKNLKNRVKSYFQRTQELDARKRLMVSLIRNIEYTEVGSDLEAIMLETNLIKQFRPRFNVRMRDDKNYVYIKITQNEDFPRIIITRHIEKDNAIYIGPKTAAHKVKKTLELIRKILPFRHCGLDIKAMENDEVEVTHKVLKYPCLYHYIQRCQAPCMGKISPKNYQETIKRIRTFLDGRPDEILDELQNDMRTCAAEKKFEKAARIRDKIKSIEEIFEKQRISDPSRTDTDVMHFITDHGKAFVNIFQIREGRLIGQENMIFELGHSTLNEMPSSQDILEACIRDYYDSATSIPEEVLVPDLLEEHEILESWLGIKKGKKVKIHWPQIGEKNKILDLSLLNAKSFAHQHKAKWMKEETPKEALASLALTLSLKKSPKRIECYDISHIGGTATVASMTVMIDGKPQPSEYRRFRLESIPEGKPDDYASMTEVLTRRLKYLQTSQFKCVTATKKLFAEIQKILTEENKNSESNNENPQNLNQKDFACLLDKKELAGFVHTIDLEKESALLCNIWIHPEHGKEKLGYGLMYELMKRKSFKKYYIGIDKKLLEYYENFGFREISTPPDAFFTAYDDTKDEFQKNDTSIIMMAETSKILANYKKFAVKPDLIVLDGGKGQLNIGVKVLDTLNLSLPICALAKQEEEIFLPEKSDSIRLANDSPALHLMQQIRDEAHRFAVSYASATHNKTLITSELDEIPGIGDMTRKKLLNHFGSLDRIRTANLDELVRIVGKKTAIMLKQTFRS